MLTAFSTGEQGEEKSARLINVSGGSIDLYWIDPETREAQLWTDDVPVADGEIVPFTSYEGHEFEVREAPNPKTGTCTLSPDQTCRTLSFGIGPNDDQSKLYSEYFCQCDEDRLTRDS